VTQTASPDSHWDGALLAGVSGSTRLAGLQQQQCRGGRCVFKCDISMGLGVGAPQSKESLELPCPVKLLVRHPTVSPITRSQVHRQR
jgi:hypothetical protein